MQFKKLKVCGLTRSEDFYALQALGVDYGGIIFYPPSPRYAVGKLNPHKIQALTSLQKVGVFVNASLDEVQKRIEEFKLDAVQLHGQESPTFCKTISAQLPLLKAFHLHTEKDLQKVAAYEPYCDYFLFDTPGKTHGGTGKRFNWHILKNYAASTPFFLSGGIGPEAMEDLKRIHLPKGVGIDLNSKFEIKPGIKNNNLIKKFICQLPIT